MISHAVEFCKREFVDFLGILLELSTFLIVCIKRSPAFRSGITALYIFHRRRVPEADGITDEDTAARQLRFSGGIGRHAPCCSAVLRDMEPAAEREAQAVAAERFDSAARTVAGLVGAQALHHGSGSTRLPAAPAERFASLPATVYRLFAASLQWQASGG